MLCCSFVICREHLSPRLFHHSFISPSLSSFSRVQSNYIYYITYFVLIAELITSIVVLNITWNDECDTHLRLWLVGYTIRSALYLPLVRYEHYFVQRMADLNQHRVFKTVKMFFEIAALMWFVLGNSYVFGAQTCPNTAPVLYKTCLVWMILGYIGLGLPLIFCLGLIFCFPCVYIVVQYLASRPDPHVEKAINQVPSRTFKAGMYSEEDAVCAICLVPYEAGTTELRIPACGHHFHKKCADDWFRIKPHCPLCRKPIDGSAPEDADPSSPRHLNSDLEAGGGGSGAGERRGSAGASSGGAVSPQARVQPMLHPSANSPLAGSERRGSRPIGPYSSVDINQ